MFEILAHSDLSHEFVLVAVHTSELAYVGKCVLQTIGKLEGINVAKTILNMRVNNKFGESKYLSTKMEGIAKTRLLSLLRCECFHWLQVKVVIQMQIVEVLTVDQQVEHVVALATDL